MIISLRAELQKTIQSAFQLLLEEKIEMLKCEMEAKLEVFVELQKEKAKEMAREMTISLLAKNNLSDRFDVNVEV